MSIKSLVLNNSDISSHSSSNTQNQFKQETVRNDVSSSTSPTNAMVFTELPIGIFEPASLEGLKQIVVSFGVISQWVPLRSLRRIMVVFKESSETFGQSVKMAREMLHETHLDEDHKLKVFALEPVNISSNNYLQIQKAKNLWLISPPPSPPSGWEALEEEPPNSSTFPSDLASALKRLKLDENGRVVEFNSSFDETQNKEILLSENPLPSQPIQINLDGIKEDLPSILIQDCGTSTEQFDSVKFHRPTAFPKTSLS